MEAPKENVQTQDQGSDVIPPVIYRCRKCRRIVATQDLILPHERGEGQKSFKWKRRSDEAEQPECSSIFVEPMKWMELVAQYGCVEDKIVCMGCKSRLGSFNWAGMQCNCGKWIDTWAGLEMNQRTGAWAREKERRLPSIQSPKAAQGRVRRAN